MRNLAQRSAEAANDTANLIEIAQKNSDSGVQDSLDVGEKLKSIDTTIEELNQIIQEVAAASEEQSTGLNQLNTTVSSMETVVQSNAANAEESASAGEELSAQAVSLNATIGELTFLVEGEGANKKGRMLPVHRVEHSNQYIPPRTTAKLPTLNKRTTSSRSIDTKSEQVIPFDDMEDLTQF